MGRLENKVVIITGAGRGIGRATAEICAREGAAVVVGDVLEEEGNATVAAIRDAYGRAIFVKTDVTQEDQCERLVATAEQEFGQVNALVNNAGIMRGAFQQVDDLELDVFESVMDVNVRGSFLMAKGAVPRLLKNPGGVIVQISSGAGVHGGSSSVAYGTSKGGSHGLAFVLEQHLAPRGIRVNVICPGSLDTPLKVENVVDGARARGVSPEEALAKANLGDPAGVGRLVAFLVSDEADYVRGSIRTR